MTEFDKVRYEAFFNELGHIEKTAMLQKVAVMPWAHVGRAAKSLFLRGRGWKSLKNIAGKAYEANVGTGFTGGLKGVQAAAGELWKTPGGRAAMLAGGGLAGGAALGGAYLAGRSSGRDSMRGPY